MTTMTIRRGLRWAHIAAGLIIGAYICSPLHLDATATLVARLSLLPVVALIGIVMWQQGRLQRSLRSVASGSASAQDGGTGREEPSHPVSVRGT